MSNEKNQPLTICGYLIVSAILVCLLSSCSPHLNLPGKARIKPHINGNAFVMPDGVKLPMYKWSSYGQPKAILLALHGFNDYGKFIEEAASFLGDRGVQTYTYDQRGFGRTRYPGIWPGTKALCQDFVNVIRLLKKSALRKDQ